MRDKKTKILIGLGIVIAVAIAVFVLYPMLNKPSETPDGSDDPVSEPTTNDSFDLVSYEVFDISEFDFKFALVKVRIKADTAIDDTLDDFVTSESFNLADYDSYLSQFATYSVFLQKVGVDFNIQSDQESAVFLLFVPLQDRNMTDLTLTMISTNESIAIDYSQNVTGTKEELGFIEDQTITDDQTFNVVVSAAIDITGETLYQNDEISNYPATAQLMAFKLTLTSLDGESITIEEAEYITEATSDTFTALDETYNKTEKRKNIIGMETSDTAQGYLLFLTLNPDREQLTYKGVLRVKINGKWNSIEVDL